MDKYNTTPLLIAARFGSQIIVELLLKWGAAIGAVDVFGRTALHCVASHLPDLNRKSVFDLRSSPRHDLNSDRHLEIVQLLLSSGTAIDGINSKGETALHIATQNGYDAIVGLLLIHGAAADTVDKAGKSVLQIAADYGRHDAWRLTLNPSSIARQNPVKARRQEMVQLLLRSGAPVDLADQDGWTALHKAAYSGFDETVRLLLDSGANILARTTSGQSPIGLCNPMQNSTRKLLLKRAVLDQLEHSGSASVEDGVGVGLQSGSRSKVRKESCPYNLA